MISAYDIINDEESEMYKKEKKYISFIYIL